MGTSTARPIGTTVTLAPRHRPGAIVAGLRLAAAVAVVYAAGAELSWGWFGATIGFAFFPAAGVTVAIVIRRGLRAWPWVALGAVTAEVAVDLRHGTGIGVAAGYAAANALEPLVGAWVVRRLDRRRAGPPELRTRAGMARFLIGAVAAGPAVGAILGAAVARAADPTDGWLAGALHWWIGDGLGVLVVGAAVLVIAGERRDLRWTARAELAGLLGVVALVGVVVFWFLDGPLEYLVLPLVWWAALRFDVMGVATAGVVLAVVANVATAHERGPFGTLDGASPQVRIALTQLYVAVDVLVPWLFAIENASRRDAEARRRDEADRRRGAELDRDVAALAASLAAASDPAEVATAFADATRRQLRADLVAVLRADGDDPAVPVAVAPPGAEPVAAAGPGVAAGLATVERLALKRLGATGHVLTGWAEPRVLADVERRFLVTGVQVLDEALERSRLLLAERRSAALRREVFDTIDEGFAVCEMIVDAHERPVDYRFVEVNPRFEAMTGLADATGRTAHELVPGLEPVWVETYARAAFGGEVLRFEEASPAMGRWFEVFAMPVGTAGQFALVFRDRTEQHRAEAALRESERRFRTLADQLPLLVWAYGPEGRLEWVNATFCAFFGVDRTVPAGGEEWRTLTHPDDAPTFEAALADALATRTPWHLELRVRRADGAWRWLESWAHPRIDEGGAFGGFLGTSADITERREAEDALRLRQQRAELMAAVLSGLEAEVTAPRQLQRLTELLVPMVADHATVEAPDAAEPLLGLSHPDPAGAAALRALRRYHRLAPNDGASVAHAAAGEVQLIPVITREMVEAMAPNTDAVQLLTRLGTHSHLAVPVDLGAGRTGALVLGRTDPARPAFDTDDVAFVREVAERAGAVLVAARLRTEEHDISVRLQRALLPDQIAWQPSVVIEARYHAASALLDVGGDWYDTFTWPDGRIAVMVGDVVGHNLDSAATMGRLRAATAVLAKRVPPSPAALLEALEQCARNAEGTDFATAVCLVIDPATGRLTYASAGHPPVLVIGPDGDVVTLDGAQTPPIGVVTERSWVEAEFTLAPGALVVMYSDGLVERRREPLDRGIERLAASARTVTHLPIGELADHLIAAAADHSPFEDDVVVACFRYTPVVATFEHDFVADPAELAPLRRRLDAWLRDIGVDAERRADVLLATGEACTNAVEHAYHAVEPAMIEVRVGDHRDHLTVSVRDHGDWRTPGPHNRQGGRGTRIMREVSSHLRLVTGPDGTRTVLTLPLPSREPVAG